MNLRLLIRMTEKRFYLMNVEDPLHEYGRFCKPVLEDGETGKQYERALEVMDLLNEQHERIQALSFLADEHKRQKNEIVVKVKETLQKYYNSSKKDYDIAVKAGMPSSLSYSEMMLFESLAKDLGVDLE